MSGPDKKPQPNKSVKANLPEVKNAKAELSAKADAKAELSVKKSAKAKAMLNAPDEVIARAIHDALLKEKETPVQGKKKHSD